MAGGRGLFQTFYVFAPPNCWINFTCLRPSAARDQSVGPTFAAGSTMNGPGHTMPRIRFSAVVVMYNEERRLFECLSSLKSCDQIIAIDLGSTDRSCEIAERCGARILKHRRVPIVEQVRHVGYENAVNDWIFVVDPDEVVEQETFALASEAINFNPRLAAIKLPMQNYFLGKALSTTIWGHGEKGPSIVHRRRIRQVTMVHDDRHALPGYETVTLSSPKHLLRHYWVDGFAQMLEKHLRYLGQEGEARYDKGERFSIRECWRSVRDSFLTNFIRLNGWKGGWRGWFLSAFHVWYTMGCMLSLRRFQKQFVKYELNAIKHFNK
jgi:glycosyltransferase involved in cell wall biosynthesis